MLLVVVISVQKRKVKIALVLRQLLVSFCSLLTEERSRARASCARNILRERVVCCARESLNLLYLREDCARERFLRKPYVPHALRILARKPCAIASLIIDAFVL